MTSYRTNMMAAVLAGLASGHSPEAVGNRILAQPKPFTDAQTRRWRDQRGYPQTGTGKRAGARLERQVRRSLGDPFEASNKCIARIKARLAATA